ncbi:MAG: hypothetical protein RL385_5418 [Pseudomonadota bacterium]
MHDSLVRAFLAASLLFAGACGDTTILQRVPAPDAQTFELEVYPVLLRDCGFPACHGDPDRFFRVFGPGRTRYRASTALFDEPTSEEIELAYHRARSMLANENGVEHSDLLRKPITENGHKGIDQWGNNVYRSASDPSYVTLLTWAKGAVATTSTAQ